MEDPRARKPTLLPQTEDEIRLVLTNRTIIGQAQGILMERYTLDAEQAFKLLVKQSRNTNVKLFTVAGRLIDERQWPFRPTPPPTAVSSEQTQTGPTGQSEQAAR